MRSLISDKDSLHVELDATWRFSIPKIKGRYRRQVDQACVFALPLHFIVAPRQWVGEVVCDMLIELDVLVILDLSSGAGPQRLCLIDRFIRNRIVTLARHLHRKRKVVQVFTYERAHSESLQKLRLLRF